MARKITLHLTLIVSGLIFLLTLAVFSLTLAPGLYPGDSAEFAAAAATLGIPHPSGYPTYTMLGFLFSKIPLGEIPWRINLMSAFFSALTAALFYQLIKKLGRDWLAGWQLETISILSALIFSFSQTFWQASLTAEVYGLNAFFTVLTLLFLLNYYQTRRPRHLFYFAFFFGLGLTNHYSLLTLAPACLLLLVFILWPDWKKQKRPIARLLLKTVVLFFLGLLPYLYLPLRARMNPELNWFNPGSIQNLGLVLSFNLRLGGQFTLNALKFLPELLTNYSREFSWPLTVLGLSGFYFLFKKDWRLGWFFLLAFLFSGPGAVLAVSRGQPVDFSLAWFLNTLFIPHYLLLVILLAGAAFGLAKLLPFKTIPGALLLLALAPLWLFAANFSRLDQSREFLTEQYSRAVLSRLPKNSLLIIKENDLNADSLLFPLIYLKIAERQRPDVTLVTDAPALKRPAELKLPLDYFSADFNQQRKQLIQSVWEQIAQPRQRPLFVASAVADLPDDLIAWPNGELYEILPLTKKPAADFWPILSVEDTPGLGSDWSLRLLASQILYNQTAFFSRLTQKEKATALLRRAIQLDPQPFSPRYQDFIKWRGEFMK